MSTLQGTTASMVNGNKVKRKGGLELFLQQSSAAPKTSMASVKTTAGPKVKMKGGLDIFLEKQSAPRPTAPPIAASSMHQTTVPKAPMVCPGNAAGRVNSRKDMPPQQYFSIVPQSLASPAPVPSRPDMSKPTAAANTQKGTPLQQRSASSQSLLDPAPAPQRPAMGNTTGGASTSKGIPLMQHSSTSSQLLAAPVPVLPRPNVHHSNGSTGADPQNNVLPEQHSAPPEPAATPATVPLVHKMTCSHSSAGLDLPTRDLPMQRSAPPEPATGPGAVPLMHTLHRSNISTAIDPQNNVLPRQHTAPLEPPAGRLSVPLVREVASGTPAVGRRKVLLVQHPTASLGPSLDPAPIALVPPTQGSGSTGPGRRNVLAQQPLPAADAGTVTSGPGRRKGVVPPQPQPPSAPYDAPAVWLSPEVDTPPKVVGEDLGELWRLRFASMNVSPTGNGQGHKQSHPLTSIRFVGPPVHGATDAPDLATRWQQRFASTGRSGVQVNSEGTNA